MTVALGCVCALLINCDSKSRGEDQGPASADGARSAETSGPTEASRGEDADAGPDTDTDSEERGRKPPGPGALDDFTERVDGSGRLVATIATDLGDIECVLYEERAPRTVANFVGLATGQKAWRDPETDELREERPFYDDVIFHRVIPDFLVQAGDRTGSGSEGAGYTIPDEIDPTLSHDRAGVLSMANKGKPDSASSQWFITLQPAEHLDGRHAIFGQCSDLEVVEEIAASPTDTANRPSDPPEIEQIEFERRHDDDR
ncbi:MAG: peptidylprolyl isomerase [Persicimonas sp.]